MRLFEDMRVGDVFELGDHTFTAASIRAFAGQFDPDPCHLDEEAGRRSPYGAMTASGWHVAVVWMRLMVDYRTREDAELRRRGEPTTDSSVSPGMRRMRWIRPVHAGDTITYRSTIVALRPSASRPEWGLCEWRNAGFNQRGEEVLSFLSTGFVRRQPQRLASGTAAVIS
ncbi:MAG: MaoC family dehydratase [Xanthobacteraceae bacterium]|nr:MAG: MaoC family dehydratase [Xanthobacteraceae bacterium]